MEVQTMLNDIMHIQQPINLPYNHMAYVRSAQEINTEEFLLKFLAVQSLMKLFLKHPNHQSSVTVNPKR